MAVIMFESSYGRMILEPSRVGVAVFKLAPSPYDGRALVLCVDGESLQFDTREQALDAIERLTSAMQPKCHDAVAEAISKAVREMVASDPPDPELERELAQQLGAMDEEPQS